MLELDYNESWAPKNWCFWTVVLGKTLESLLYSKEIHPVHPNGNQSWIFFGRTDAEAETPILWPPDVKSWLIWKDPDAGKDLIQEEKGTTEGELVGWHHRLYGHEFEQALAVGDGQRGLKCCSPWGHKDSDSTEWLNWTEHFIYLWHVQVHIHTCTCVCVVLCVFVFVCVFLQFLICVWLLETQWTRKKEKRKKPNGQ